MPPGTPSAHGGTSTTYVHRKGILGAIARFWQRSYAADYLGLLLLLTAYILLQLFVEPFHRMFTLDDPAIQFPHALVERVSVAWLFAYAAGVPLLAILVWAAIYRPSGHKLHVTILGLLISLILTSFLTDVVKNSVGRPRPDLLERCKPKEGTPGNGLVTYEVCTESEHHTLHDGWRSFPSGHSSSAFSGLGYLASFLAGQFHAMRPRTNLASILAVLCPLLGALLIAISRCEDYRHDVYDVSVGSALGLSVAYLSYRRYYPPLRSGGCGNPIPSRAESGRSSKFEGSSEGYGAVSGDNHDPSEDDEAMPLSRAGSRRDLESGT